MLITKAPPAAPIALNSSTLQLFKNASGDGACFLSIPASSGLDMVLLDVTATGSIEPNQPGTLQVGIFALVNEPNMGTPSTNTGDWVLLGSNPPEPVGGSEDLKFTSWMVMAQDLMYNFASGKMQGVFRSNVADTPTNPLTLDTNPNGIRDDVSPVVYFAIAAMFTPDADDGSKPDLTLATFTLSGEV